MAAPGGPGRGEDPRPDVEPIDVSILAPDDPSELDLDVRAWRRERAAAGRRHRIEKLLLTRRWRRYGLSGPLVAGVLVVVAVFGGLLALLVPSGGRDRAARQPLDRAAPSPAGQIGGLLADRPLRVDGAERPALDFRPAVLALLPTPCRCADLVNELSGQAAEFGLRLVLVASDGHSAELPRLVRAARRGAALAAYDPGGRLAGDYGARGPTLVLVRDDGRVTAVEREARTGVRREPTLRQLVTSGPG